MSVGRVEAWGDARVRWFNQTLGRRGEAHQVKNAGDMSAFPCIKSPTNAPIQGDEGVDVVRGEWGSKVRAKTKNFPEAF